MRSIQIPQNSHQLTGKSQRSFERMPARLLEFEANSFRHTGELSQQFRCKHRNQAMEFRSRKQVVPVQRGIGEQVSDICFFVASNFGQQTELAAQAVLSREKHAGREVAEAP